MSGIGIFWPRGVGPTMDACGPFGTGGRGISGIRGGRFASTGWFGCVGGGCVGCGVAPDGTVGGETTPAGRGTGTPDGGTGIPEGGTVLGWDGILEGTGIFGGPADAGVGPPDGGCMLLVAWA